MGIWEIYDMVRDAFEVPDSESEVSVQDEENPGEMAKDIETTTEGRKGLPCEHVGEASFLDSYGEETRGVDIIINPEVAAELSGEEKDGYTDKPVTRSMPSPTSTND